VSAQRTTRSAGGPLYGQGATGVHMRGVPHRLRAVGPRLTGVSRWATVDLAIPGVELPSPLLALVQPLGTNAAEVDLTLPTMTPPGAYAGTVDIDGQALRLEIEVEPHTRLAARPRSMALRLKPATVANVEITVVNEGNVPGEIQGAYALDFVDDNTFDHGFDAAVRAELVEGQRRVDVFFDALAQGNGGTGRLEVEEGAGALAPGQVRGLRVRLSVPKEVRLAHTYTGIWHIEDAAISIHVEVVDGRSATEVSR